MKAILLRADRHNLKFGNRSVKYKTWDGDVFEADDVDEKEIDIERAFCEVEVNSLEDFLDLIKEFGELIIDIADDFTRNPQPNTWQTSTPLRWLYQRIKQRSTEELQKKEA